MLWEFAKVVRSVRISVSRKNFFIKFLILSSNVINLINYEFWKYLEGFKVTTIIYTPFGGYNTALILQLFYPI